MKFYITSDTHFNHKNICGPEGFEEGRRVYNNPEEMNEAIITNFNNKVTKEDTTYHLGDIALNMRREEILELLNRLNGKFIFVKGNHDSTRIANYLSSKDPEKFIFHDVGVKLKHNRKTFLLTHYPMVLGYKRSKIRNLHGHIHGNATKEPNSLNVGVDSPEIPDRPFGEPLLLEEALDLVNDKWYNKMERDKAMNSFFSKEPDKDTQMRVRKFFNLKTRKWE